MEGNKDTKASEFVSLQYFSPTDTYWLRKARTVLPSSDVSSIVVRVNRFNLINGEIELITNNKTSFCTFVSYINCLDTYDSLFARLKTVAGDIMQNRTRLAILFDKKAHFLPLTAATSTAAQMHTAPNDDDAVPVDANLHLQLSAVTGRTGITPNGRLTPNLSVAASNGE